MRTLNISGIKPLDSLSLSVSQGAITAGPVNVPAWGGGGGGGTIIINAVHRSIRQFAPDSIRFQVDLSSSSFDTSGPSMGTPYYDPRMHDLIYLWDMGDTGNWDAPVNVLTAWKDRSAAKGPEVRHLYRAPGVYTVSVLVVEPSTGKSATATLEVTVGDPQDYYGDANTIYINNVGDSDFSDVPVGVPSANKINIDELKQVKIGGTFTPDATWALFKGTSRRWRFKRGGSWDVAVCMHSGDGPDPMFDDYGDAGDPKPEFTVMTPGDAVESVILRTDSAFDNTSAERQPTTSPPEIRIQNIHMQGTFDAVTDYGVGPPYSNAVLSITALRLYVEGCSFDGIGSTTIYGSVLKANPTFYNDLHVDNSSFGNFGGEYVVMWVNSDHSESSVALTGVRWNQPGDGKSSKSGYAGSRSACRTDGLFHHARGCDVFHTDEEQPGLTFWKTPISDGALINVHSLAIEGGLEGISIAGNFADTPEDRSYTGNIIIDDVIHVGNWRTRATVALSATGATVRNVLSICPNVPRRSNAYRGIVQIEPLFDVDVTIPDSVLDAPIRIYNCTMRMDRSLINNNGHNPLIISSEKAYEAPDAAQPFTDVSETNNVVHNTDTGDSGDMPFAPMTDVALWTPRSLGYRDPETGILSSEYATPSGAVKDTKPLPGSAALGAALSGNVSYMDLAGTVRTAPADKGAWEVA